VVVDSLIQNDEGEVDPYNYEEDFEVDETENDEEDENGSSQEEVELKLRSSSKKSQWQESFTSPKSTPWKTVTRSEALLSSSLSQKPTASPIEDTTPKEDRSSRSSAVTAPGPSTRSHAAERERSPTVQSSHISPREESANPQSPSTGGLAEAIALRLASMSKEQQQQLLMMLNLTDPGVESNPTSEVKQQVKDSKEDSKEDRGRIASPPDTKLRHLAPQTTVTKSPKPTHVSPTLDRKNEAKTSPIQKENSESKSIPSRSPLVHSRSPDPPPALATSVVVAAADPPGPAVSGSEMNSSSLAALTTIKIKLHNSWKKTKYSSLACLRMLMSGANRDVDLSSFSCQVWVGNTMLPKTSDVAHSVSLLFSKSRVRQHRDWKFPIDSGTQLILTGHLTEKLSDFELLIWNGIYQEATISAVRDADVYVNNNLLWSGVLSETPGEIIQLRGPDVSPRVLCLSPNEGRTPSNVIPFSSDLNDTKKATVVTTLPLNPIRKSTVAKEESKPKYEDSLTFSGLASSTTSSSMAMSSSTYPLTDLDNEAAATSSSVPSWFSDLKTPRPALASQQIAEQDAADQEVLTKPNSRPGSRRSRVDVSTPNPLLQEKDESAPRKQPTSRGSRRNPKKLDSFSSEEVREPQKIESSSVSSTRHAKPTIAKRKTRQEEQEEDLTLRHSLDALNDSDRKNRGRLQQELTTVVISGGAGDYPLPASATRSGANSEEESQHGIPLEATVAVNLRMKAVENLSGGVLDQELQQQTATQKSSLLRQRSERIDKVQEKVTSALETLAGVMSTLPRGGGGGGFKYGGGNSETKSLRAEDRRSPTAAPAPAVERRQQQPTAEDEDIAKILDMVNGLDMEMSQSIFTKNTAETQQAAMPTTQPMPTNQRIDQNSSDTSDNLTSVGNAPPSLDSTVHETPIFPKGNYLEFVILSTWGDPYYVGLNGIDLFDQRGQILLPSHQTSRSGGNGGIKSISSTPSDINILPEYHDDPRTIQNLLDEVNFTRDDLHVWLAPHGSTLTPKLPFVATIGIEFDKLTTLSMIRIWNYNKSRTHCYRGVKEVQIKLNSQVIYEGTIRMATGLLSSCDDCSDLIVFCNDQKVFQKILQYDLAVGYQQQGPSLSQQRGTEESNELTSLQFVKGKNLECRPRTADKSTAEGSGLGSVAEEDNGGNSKIMFRKKTSSSKSPQLPFEKVVQVDSFGIRPTTSAIRPLDSFVTTDSQPKHVASSREAKGMAKGVTTSDRDEEMEMVECQSLKLVIERTWGDISYVGLAGVEILTGAQGTAVLDVEPRMVDASPRDLSAIGFFDDPRTPEKLIDGINDTTDDTHMWLIPFTKGSTHLLKFKFDQKIHFSGLNLWNYNKSPVDSLRGVRILSIYADSTLLGSVEVRLAPGCDGIDFKQTLFVSNIRNSHLNSRRNRNESPRYITPSLRQDYEVPLLPSGMNWKVTFHSNWGDGYYIGLDGLEFLDERGEVMDLTTDRSTAAAVRIEASPHSLQDIGIQDSRGPTNLVTQPLSDPSGVAAWLAPLAQCMTEAERMGSLRRLQLQQRGHKKLPPGSSSSDPLFTEENVLFVFFDVPVSVSAIR
jgi:hypothetical protein